MPPDGTEHCELALVGVTVYAVAGTDNIDTITAATTELTNAAETNDNLSPTADAAANSMPPENPEAKRPRQRHKYLGQRPLAPTHVIRV